MHPGVEIAYCFGTDRCISYGGALSNRFRRWRLGLEYSFVLVRDCSGDRYVERPSAEGIITPSEASIYVLMFSV